MAGELSKFFVTIGSKFDGKGLSEAQKDIAKFTAAVGAMTAAIGVGAVIAAAKFQQQLAMVATMLGDTAADVLPKYKRELKSMAVQYGESTETLSKGLYDILSAGIDGAEALDVLAASATAAKAGITDTAVAADAITTILNSYGMEAKDAGDISDWFFTIVKRGKTTFAELAPVVGRVAALASSSGLSIDELGAALATMTKSGIKTEEAVTSLRGVLTAFLKPSKQAKEAAKDLGVELSTQGLKSNGLIKTLEKLEGATDEQVAAIFGNVQALAGLSTILKDTSVFYEDLEAITNRAGAAQKAFKTMTKTLTFKIEQMKQAVINLASSYGDELLPAVEAITQSLIFVLGAIDQFPPIIGVLIGLLVILVGGLAAATIAMNTFRKGIVLATTSTKKLWLTLAAHPLIAVTAALAALTLGILGYWERAIDAADATRQLGDSTRSLLIIQKEELAVIRENIRLGKVKGKEAEDAAAKAILLMKSIASLESESKKAKQAQDIAITDEEQERLDAAAEKENARIESQGEFVIAMRDVGDKLLEEANEKKEKAEKEREARKRARVNLFARMVTDSLQTIQKMESVTWKNVGEAYKGAVKKMIGYTIQQLVAEKIKALAMASMNTWATFGAAAYQIAAVIAVGTAASAALASVQSFDEGGIVQGAPGQPVMVQALGGEKFLGRDSIGNDVGGSAIHVHLANPFFLGTRKDAKKLAEIVSDGIFRKVNTQRRT